MTGRRTRRCAQAGRRGSLLRIALAIVTCAVSACATAVPGPRVPDEPEPRSDGSVVVASFDFPESELLGELYASAVEAAGVPVRRELGLGSRELLGPALEQGLVDVVPEYLGTALASLDPEADVPNRVGPARRELARAAAGRGLVVLRPGQAQTENVVVVSRVTALTHQLRRTSDLADLAPAFRFGGPPECPRRPFCLPGLERAYGLRFERFVPLDAGGPLTVAALRNDGIDVGVLFSTDPLLGPDGDLVALEDDRGLQPAENIVPVVRTEVLERVGAPLRDALEGLSSSLTTDDLRDLNREVAEGRDPADVAAAFLRRAG